MRVKVKTLVCWEVMSATGKVWIDKWDDRGRTVDVHALRHSTGTHLSKAGVRPRIAQAVMRHGSIDLTMNTYTDPQLLDAAGAVEALPDLPLDGAGNSERVRATGTYEAASPLAPTSDESCKSPTNPDNFFDTRRFLHTAQFLREMPEKRRNPAGEGWSGRWESNPHSQLGRLAQTPKNARKTQNSCGRCAPVAQNLPQSDPDLAEIERLWPRLPEALKAGIVAMVKAAK